MTPSLTGDTALDPLTGQQVPQNSPIFGALSLYYRELKMYADIDAAAKTAYENKWQNWAYGYFWRVQNALPVGLGYYPDPPVPSNSHTVQLSPGYIPTVLEDGPVTPPLGVPDTAHWAMASKTVIDTDGRPVTQTVIVPIAEKGAAFGDLGKAQTVGTDVQTGGGGDIASQAMKMTANQRKALIAFLQSLDA